VAQYVPTSLTDIHMGCNLAALMKMPKNRKGTIMKKAIACLLVAILTLSSLPAITTNVYACSDDDHAHLDTRTHYACSDDDHAHLDTHSHNTITNHFMLDYQLTVMMLTEDDYFIMPVTPNSPPYYQDPGDGQCCAYPIVLLSVTTQHIYGFTGVCITHRVSVIRSCRNCGNRIDLESISENGCGRRGPF